MRTSDIERIREEYWQLQGYTHRRIDWAIVAGYALAAAVVIVINAAVIYGIVKLVRWSWGS